ncbi:MAG: HEAT repeat domain-containing protein [Myxococcales bacterium]|nr:HEAT repeat domain-containing protein [Myxococcales bacterium]
MPGARDAIVEGPGDLPYEGKPGKTRLESVHLAGANGAVRSLKVYRVVNVGTHPELRQRALSGTLHRLDDGGELALPFVFHDPKERKFALVIPAVLAHQELREWSALMQEIAADATHAVPRYVREAPTVVGVKALGTFVREQAVELDGSELLEGSGPGLASSELDAARASALSDRERLVLEREREVAEVERGLVRTAESLTSREGELLRREEQLQTALADLEIREQEVATRSALGQLEAAGSDGVWQEVGAGEASLAVESPGPASQPSAQAAGQRPPTAPLASTASSGAPNPAAPAPGTETTVVVDSSEIARRASQNISSTVPPPHPTPRTGPPPLRPRGRPKPPPLHPEASHDVHVVRPPPLPSVPGIAVDDSELVEVPSGALAAQEVHRTEAHPEVDPPKSAVGAPTGVMSHRMHADELWLYVNWPEAELEGLRASPDLMLQCVEVDGYPVLVLALFAHAAGTTATVGRLVLPALTQDSRRMLEALEQSFRARIAVYVDGGYRETLTVAMLREGVARAAREFGDECENARGGVDDATGDAPDVLAAVDRVRAFPPALDADDLPFGPARRRMAGTFAVRAAVEQLASWMQPERLRVATLRYGVPQHVIEASARRVLRAALAYGVALPQELVEAAVRFGVAAGQHELLAEQLRAFKHKVIQGENDLDDVGTQRNWELLFDSAASAGVLVAPDLREFAASLGLGPAPAPGSDSDPAPDLSEIALRERLGEPEHRVAAFQELCQRSDTASLSHMMEMLEDLTPAELCLCAPHLVRFGEGCVDPLLTAVEAQSMHVRHVAALLLGRLGVTRTLPPLLRQLEQEPTAVWSEIARAIGQFGPSALDPLAQALPHSQDPDRLMVALAHLANHGCAKDVEKLENSEDMRIALGARRAMARRSRLEWEDLAIREQRTLTDNSPTARFSQSFFAEASKLEN